MMCGRRAILLLAAAVLQMSPLAVTQADAQTQAASQSTAQRPARAQRTDPFAGFAGNSKDPIRIDAARLEVFEKEQKAVYSGDVVTVRGTTVIRAPQMTIFFDNKKAQAGQPSTQGTGRTAGGQPGVPQDGALRRIEFRGPVNVVNGTQTASSNELIYDAIAKRVSLRGNAVVADGPNIQRGELIVYDTETGQAVVSNPGGRVQGIFTPGGAEDGARRPRSGSAPAN